VIQQCRIVLRITQAANGGDDSSIDRSDLFNLQAITFMMQFWIYLTTPLINSITCELINGIRRSGEAFASNFVILCFAWFTCNLLDFSGVG